MHFSKIEEYAQIMINHTIYQKITSESTDDSCQHLVFNLPNGLLYVLTIHTST